MGIRRPKESHTRVFTGSGGITMLNESVLAVNKASGAATAVTLPAGPKPGQVVVVKDAKGDAATNNITVTPAAGNVDGAANHVISENYGAATYYYNGTEWNIVSTGNAVSSTELGFLNGVTAGTAAASKATVLDANQELNGIGVIRKADVVVATGEVLALNATPKTIVAGVASTYLEFLGAYLFLDFATTAYAGIAGGEDLVFKYTNASGVAVSQQIETTGFLDATADALAIAYPDGADVSGLIASVAGAAIVLHLLVGEVTTGDSPIKVRCYYRHVRAAALAAIT